MGKKKKHQHSAPREQITPELPEKFPPVLEDTEIPEDIVTEDEPSLNAGSEIPSEELPAGQFDEELGTFEDEPAQDPSNHAYDTYEEPAVDTTYPVKEERKETPISINVPPSGAPASLASIPGEQKAMTVTSKIRSVMASPLKDELPEEPETPEEPAEELLMNTAEEEPAAEEEKTPVMPSVTEEEAEDLVPSQDEEGATVLFDPVKEKEEASSPAETETPEEPAEDMKDTKKKKKKEKKSKKSKEPVLDPDTEYYEPKFLKKQKNPGLAFLLKAVLTLALFIAALAGTYLFTLWFCSGERKLPENADYISEDGDDIRINKTRTWYVTPNDSTYTAVIYDLHGAIHNPGSLQDKDLLVTTNLRDALATVKDLDPSFILFQDVDQSSTRSNKTDETETIMNTFVHYSKMYCPNYKTMYEFWPIPHFNGMRNGGFYTLSKYHVSDSYRKLLPRTEHMPAKFFAKSACVSVNVIPVSGSDRDLFIVNVDFSDYSDSSAWNAQMGQLKEILAGAKERDDFIVIGGNFQANFQASQASSGIENDPVLDVSILGEGYHIVTPSNTSALCTDIELHRTLNTSSYRATQNGFIVSDNVEATAEIIDTGFRYSNHNPVQLTFILRE